MMTDGPFKGEKAFHWAWIILLVSFVDLFISYGIRLGYGIVLPEMIRTLDLTRTQGGNIFNAYLFSYILCSPFMGYLTDRFGARRVMALFGVFLGGGTLLMSTVQDYRQGCFFFAIAGIGASAMWIPIITMIQRWVSADKKGFMIGLLSTGYGVSFAVMGRVFPVIVDAWDWRSCWIFQGIAAFVMIFFNGFFLRSDPGEMGLKPWGSRQGESSPLRETAAIPPLKVRYVEIAKASRFWIIGLSYFFSSAALYMVTTYMVDYARFGLGFSYEKASSLATVHGLGQVVGVLVIPMLSDSIGRRNTLLLSNLFIAVNIAAILVSGGNAFWLFSSVGLFGAFYGVIFPMYSACGGDYFRKEVMGSVMGAWTPFYGLGAIGGHRLAGAIRDGTGSFFGSYVISIGFALLAAVFLVFIGNLRYAGIRNRNP